MAYRPMSDRPAYPEPANRLLPPFHSDVCTCMPVPLSWKSGLGMNVAVLPYLRATFLTMYLYLKTLSAISTSGENFMSISHCPAVATS